MEVTLLLQSYAILLVLRGPVPGDELDKTMSIARPSVPLGRSNTLISRLLGLVRSRSGTVGIRALVHCWFLSPSAPEPLTLDNIAGSTVQLLEMCAT